jgi:dipeptidyl aminopeptidase/acylaminoacyl peptidase
MRPTFVIIAVLGLPGASLLAQGAAPQPDVYLAALSFEGGGLRVGRPTNVTHREGYDNQPSFSPDGRTLFFTSTRADAQADIYRYEIAAARTERVTTTDPESEYSATVMPSGDAISVIRVERDSTQRLWRVPLGGGASTVILEGVKPVGYHAWADDRTLALFVLGTPATLQIADVRTGRTESVATKIGRSLHRMPGSRRISFVSKAAKDTNWVMALDLTTRAVQPVAPLPKGVEDYAWLPDGRMVAGDGSRLVVRSQERDAVWTEIADLSGAGLGGISRLAIAPGGDRIAIVAVPRGER